MQAFLIDECLTKDLVRIAESRGHPASFVPHLGKAGMKDEQLVTFIEQNDLLMVTNNRRDFLRLYGLLPLHAGLLIIVPSVDRRQQAHLFGLALDRLATMPDLVNQVMEVDAEGGITLRPLAAPDA